MHGMVARSGRRLDIYLRIDAGSAIVEIVNYGAAWRNKYSTIKARTDANLKEFLIFTFDCLKPISVQ
jgi:hypothetical protein